MSKKCYAVPKESGAVSIMSQVKVRSALFPGFSNCCHASSDKLGIAFQPDESEHNN